MIVLMQFVDMSTASSIAIWLAYGLENTFAMRKHGRAVIVVAGVVAVAIVIPVLLLMSARGTRLIFPIVIQYASARDKLDSVVSHKTCSGLYCVSFTSVIEPVPINRIQNWTVHVETTDGHPVNNAEISVSGGMPQHGHGLPTRPRVTQHLGNGDYVVEGLKFHMTGQWEVRFNISSAGQRDSVTINLLLQ